MNDQHEGHGVKRTRNWVQEAREQLHDERAYLNSIQPYIRSDGTREAPEHFRKREHRAKQRVQERHKVYAHLERKLEAAIDERREDRQDDKPPFDRLSTNIVTFDGKPVVESAAYWLWRAREAGWRGVLVSGWRSPEESIAACHRICGQDSCPGLCAGASSNHGKKTYPGPAVDVSEYDEFERLMIQMNSPLKNDLPIDPVHFSPSGH